eukprot:SAG22_NODE_593_length_8808_cov_21.674590_2_plen_255_part_00
MLPLQLCLRRCLSLPSICLSSSLAKFPTEAIARRFREKGAGSGTAFLTFKSRAQARKFERVFRKLRKVGTELGRTKALSSCSASAVFLAKTVPFRAVCPARQVKQDRQTLTAAHAGFDWRSTQARPPLPPPRRVATARPRVTSRFTIRQIPLSSTHWHHLGPGRYACRRRRSRSCRRCWCRSRHRSQWSGSPRQKSRRPAIRGIARHLHRATARCSSPVMAWCGHCSLPPRPRRRTCPNHRRQRRRRLLPMRSL